MNIPNLGDDDDGHLIVHYNYCDCCNTSQLQYLTLISVLTLILIRTEAYKSCSFSINYYIYNYCNMRVGNINSQALLLRKGIPSENWNDFPGLNIPGNYFHKNRSIYSHVGCMFIFDILVRF